MFLLATSLTPLDLTRPIRSATSPTRCDNYRQLLEDERASQLRWVQVKLSFWTVLLQLLIGLGFALLLNMRSSLLEALRTVFLIPMVLPPIVVAIIWKVIYTPDISPLHWAIRALGWSMPALITDANWALTAIIIADTWEWFPFTMLMILAALQMMPEEHIDAARVDGASPWQMTWYVTLPYLQGVLLVAGPVPPDRQHQGLPADLHPDRRRAGQRDGGDELLRLPPGLQLLLPRLFERHHRRAAGRHRRR